MLEAYLAFTVLGTLSVLLGGYFAVILIERDLTK